MLESLSLRTMLAALLCLLASSAAAIEPCKPFEDGRVDAELLATMRQAAKEGRMYRVDAETSSVGFCVRHFPFQEFRGQFRNIVGGLALPPDSSQYGHALLLIHSASLVSENSDLVPLVIGHSFIDAERYPEILFVGRRFVWLNDRQARIYGELTLRGRKQPVVFTVDVEHDAGEDAEGDRRIRMRGTTLVNRFQFDMTSYRYFVSEQVQLCLAVELVPWEYQGGSDSRSALTK
jgi:polyisoprenoid-binding protein YceI